MANTVENIPTRVMIANNPMPRDWIVFFDSLVRNINNQFTELDSKIDKVAGTAGNLIRLKADGSIEDAGASAITLEATTADFVSQAISVNSVTVIAGSDSINLAQLNADLSTMVGQMNSIRATLNSVMTSLINAGLMESS